MTFQILVRHSVIEQFDVEAESLDEAVAHYATTILPAKLASPEPAQIVEHQRDYDLIAVVTNEAPMRARRG